MVKPRIHQITVTTLIKEHGTSMAGQMEQLYFDHLSKTEGFLFFSENLQ